MTRTSIPWYEFEDDFNAILGMIPVDESRGAMSYPHWVASIEIHEKQLATRGFSGVRIPVEPAPIKAWCEANNLIVCRKSISAFCTEVLAKRLLVSRGLNKGAAGQRDGA